MNLARWRDRLLLNEDLNFLLTNRIPRIAATRFMGWFSRIRSPALTRASIAVWRLFTDLDLSEARQTRFESLQACFTRELKPGLRPFDPDPALLCSPCDGIVGAQGRIDGTQVLQAKGSPYPLAELLRSPELARRMLGGHYLTLRLTSSMYHRFHAPQDLVAERVIYLSGDTWNVNPIALKRVERLFCRNERAVIECRLPWLADAPLVLVPVAAVLVASIRLHWLDVTLHLRWPGPHRIERTARLGKGQEMGWFEHGSTIILLLPPGLEPLPAVQEGARVMAGQALFRAVGPQPGANPSRPPP